MVQCAGCDRPILDRFLLNVLDRAWHAKCVQCCDCKCPLTDKCFSREGKLYCRNDFFRRFGTKCAGCTQGISPSDLVRRARNKVFHLKCFTCMVCRKQLSTGEELYVLDENKFICKDDYLGGGKTHHGKVLPSPSSQARSPGSNIGDDMDDLDLKGDGHSTATPTPPSAGTTPTTTGTPNSTVGEPPGGHMGSEHTNGSEKESRDSGGSVDGDRENRDHENTAPDENNIGAKRRGPRTTIKAKQLETLKAAFAATPKPTRHIREQLAQETGLNMRVIQVWFQNRRSKERRMKQLSSLGARRHFFRNPRRMRALRPGMSPDGLDDSPEMVPNPGFNYFSDNSNQGDFGYGTQAFYDFFPGQQPQGAQGPEGLGFPGIGAQSPAVPTPTSMEQAMSGPMGTGNVNLGADAPYLPHNDILSQRSSPDSVLNLPPVGGDSYGPARASDAAAAAAFSAALSHPPMTETPVW